MPFFHFVVSLISTTWIIQLLEEAFSITYLCRGLPDGKKGFFLFLRDMAVLFLVLFAICFILLYIMPSFFIVSRYLTFFLILQIYLNTCSTSSGNSKRIMAFSMASMAMCVSSISSKLGIILSSLMGNGIMTNMIGSFLLAALIPLAVFLRHFVLEDYENSIPNGGVLLIIVGALSIFCLLCYEQIQQNTRTLEIAQLFLIAYGGMLAIIMASVYAIYVMCTSRRDLLQLQSETERLRSEKEMSAMTSASLEDLRCLRHDLKNQYSYINLLIAEKRFDELESYCNRLSDHIPSQLLIIDCGNDFFNVLLNMWINRAKHHGIDVESHLVIPPALPFSEDDLCTLIANLFENALEACEKKSSGPIRMDILPWRDYLSIVFSNPTNAVSLKRHGGGLMTTKSNLNLHGYGTRSVARIASHYNGIVDYSIQDGWFTAKVLLDMKQNSSDSASS